MLFDVFLVRLLLLVLSTVRLSCQVNDGHIQDTIVPGQVLVQDQGLPSSSSSPPAPIVRLDDRQASSASPPPHAADEEGWLDYIEDEKLDEAVKEEGIVFLTAREPDRGIGLFNDDNATDKFWAEFTTSIDGDLLIFTHIPGRRPVIFRDKFGDKNQIKLLIDQQDYYLKLGEFFPNLYASQKYWHPDGEDPWEGIYNELRRGNEIHLATGVGGPSTGYVVNVVDRKVYTWFQAGPFDQKVVKPMMNCNRLWWRCVKGNSPDQELLELHQDEPVGDWYSEDFELDTMMLAMTHFEIVFDNIPDCATPEEEETPEEETPEAVHSTETSVIIARIAEMEADEVVPEHLFNDQLMRAQFRHDYNTEIFNWWLGEIGGIVAPPMAEDLQAGQNWQLADDDVVDTPLISEKRFLSAMCSVCMVPHAEGQDVGLKRCGHSLCLGCVDACWAQGWLRCFVCRQSKTSSVKKYTTATPKSLYDIYVKADARPVRTSAPASSSAAAAASLDDEAPESNDESPKSNDFLPRSEVVKNLVAMYSNEPKMAAELTADQDKDSNSSEEEPRVDFSKCDFCGSRDNVQPLQNTPFAYCAKCYEERIYDVFDAKKAWEVQHTFVEMMYGGRPKYMQPRLGKTICSFKRHLRRFVEELRDVSPSRMRLTLQGNVLQDNEVIEEGFYGLRRLVLTLREENNASGNDNIAIAELVPSQKKKWSAAAWGDEPASSSGAAAAPAPQLQRGDNTAMAELEDNLSEKCDQCGSRSVICGGSEDAFINLCKKCHEESTEMARKLAENCAKMRETGSDSNQGEGSSSEEDDKDNKDNKEDADSGSDDLDMMLGRLIVREHAKRARLPPAMEAPDPTPTTMPTPTPDGEAVKCDFCGSDWKVDRHYDRSICMRCIVYDDEVRAVAKAWHDDMLLVEVRLAKEWGFLVPRGSPISLIKQFLHESDVLKDVPTTNMVLQHHSTRLDDDHLISEGFFRENTLELTLLDQDVVITHEGIPSHYYNNDSSCSAAAPQLPRDDVATLIDYIEENNADGSNNAAIAELEDKLANNCKRMREAGSDSNQGEGSSSEEDDKDNKEAADWSVTVKCDEATKVFTSTRPLTVFALRELIKKKGVFGITGDVFVFIKNKNGFSLRTDAVVDNGTTVYCTWEPTYRSLRCDAPPWVSEDEDEEAYKPRALNLKKYEDKGYHVKTLKESRVDDTVHIHITLQRPPPQDSTSSNNYSSLPISPPYPSP